MDARTAEIAAIKKQHGLDVGITKSTVGSREGNKYDVHRDGQYRGTVSFVPLKKSKPYWTSSRGVLHGQYATMTEAALATDRE